MNVLLFAPETDIRQACPAAIADAILNVRSGNVHITPGYDGEYGTTEVAASGARSREKEFDF